MLIDRYIILGEQYCDFEKYDLFDMQINTFAADKIADMKTICCLQNKTMSY